ncbi:SDR family oxidoreductase [Chlorobium phaeovibrioides]|uniref:SDR family oxidoreductase n=1 Tax=Chlorobium phaeovibrioides TaxID=1094 RepID=A0A5M8IFA9_CHLPH|nr:SDR family oxidoreductase [Chlorobium phaeovibrioides]KAA6233102.1 SDR family oxidoreductase [Chlorobium phaeovibrioides]RTY35788.1 SDR family oxidoreductase [Chlorobium phaeovibrioides]
MNPPSATTGRKVCFMTGASGRLGSEMALAAAGKGYTVFFTWHNSHEHALETLEKIQWVSPESRMVRCNVSRPKEIQAAFQEFRKHFDRLDLLIASASNFYRTPLGEVTEEDWDSLVDTNLKGTFFTMQEGAAIMRLQPFVSRIITMADISADLVWENFAPYTVSKSGVVHLTKVFAKSFAPTILVNSIAPGTITLNPEKDMDSPDTMASSIPLKRIGEALDIVKTLHFLIESDYITGQVIRVDGGRMLQ